MKKKRLLTLIVIFVLLISFMLPNFEVKAESEWQKIDRQLQEIQNQKKEAASKAKSLDNEIKNNQNQQANAQEELVTIESEINEAEQKLFSLEAKIETVTEDAKQAADNLDQAEKRVEDRDHLLKTRVRLMYNKGNVDYLEVLLGSNSFSDFLSRFNALEKILDSDKKILKDNIDDKNTITQKKQEIDKALADLESLYTESENLRATLLTKKEDQKVRIASLEEAKQNLNESKKEEEEFLQNLATKESELIKQQYALEYNGGFFAWPVPSSHRITSPFGLRTDPINGTQSGHNGLDIGHAPGKTSLFGADIVSPADGVVIVASYVNGFGNTVMIDHGSGIWTLFGHIRNGGIFVKVGQKVKKGQKIAEVGSTGRSTGPHLHFTVYKNHVAVNPMDYFKK